MNTVSIKDNESMNECLCETHVIRVINGKFYKNGKIEEGDLWIANGKIMDAQKLFYDKARCREMTPDEILDVHGMTVIPGFIDIQINGAYGVDFSDPSITEADIIEVRKKLLSTGCTCICPTMITSHPNTYKKLLPLFKPEEGSIERGCSIAGVHAEGPFISPNRAGAHPPEYIQAPSQVEQSIRDCYGSLQNIRLITIAPELEGSLNTIQYLHNQGITVSLGHTASHLATAIDGVHAGATLITHLFNAMTPFHHRDPGVIGLLGMPTDTAPYYSLIVDGIHSHPYTVKFAEKANGKKCVLITDAMAAMGLGEGHHKLGKQNVIVKNHKAVLEENEDTLAGSIVSIDECVRNFKEYTGCTLEEAIRNATSNPAKVIGISHAKGDLLPGMDADFVILDDSNHVQSTYIAGKLVWSCSE